MSTLRWVDFNRDPTVPKTPAIAPPDTRVEKTCRKCQGKYMGTRTQKDCEKCRKKPMIFGRD